MVVSAASVSRAREPSTIWKNVDFEEDLDRDGDTSCVVSPASRVRVTVRVTAGVTALVLVTVTVRAADGGRALLGSIAIEGPEDETMTKLAE